MGELTDLPHGDVEHPGFELTDILKQLGLLALGALLELLQGEEHVAILPFNWLASW
jgi:hypothetical protein